MSFNPNKDIGPAKRMILSGINTWLNHNLGMALSSTTRLFYPRHNGNWVEVTQIPVELPRLSPEFDGYRIAQISDFHLGTWLSSQQLAEAVDLVNNNSPDLIAITGDLVAFHHPPSYNTLDRELGKLKARDGVVAVLGNHDHWSHPEEIRKILKRHGIQELNNRFLPIKRKVSLFYVCGIDDFMTGHDRLGQVLSSLPPDGCAILLAHEPDFADFSAATGRFDLQISGHSHGGQIVFPVIGSIFLPNFAKKYTSGRYIVNGMVQYTNRGLGTAEFQVRLNCTPEISIFTLSSVKNITKTDRF